MSRRLALVLAARTRAVVLLAAAVLAGAVGGAWAVAGAPVPDRVTALTVADTGDADEPGESARPKEPKAKPTDHGKAAAPGQRAATAKSKAGKSGKAGKAGAANRPAGAGVHGACVSAVARSDATGGPDNTHGGAVSRAAATCPHPTPSAGAPD